MLTISSFAPLAAGQERFRSISRLYYRGANACILCYSITDAQSFADMGAWLTELRRNLPHDIVLHVVGTKSDVVAREPSKREVPFERCIVSSPQKLYSSFVWEVSCLSMGCLATSQSPLEGRSCRLRDRLWEDNVIVSQQTAPVLFQLLTLGYAGLCRRESRSGSELHAPADRYPWRTPQRARRWKSQRQRRLLLQQRLHLRRAT